MSSNLVKVGTGFRLAQTLSLPSGLWLFWCPSEVSGVFMVGFRDMTTMYVQSRQQLGLGLSEVIKRSDVDEISAGSCQKR